MPLYALPIAAYSSTQHAHANTSRRKFSNLAVRKRKRPHRKFSNLPVRKRKRKRSHETEESSDDENSSLNSDDENSPLNSDAPPAAKNPLGLTPMEIAQYQLAGLELDEELPGVRGVKDFPHRALPEGYGSRGKKEGDERQEQKEGTSRGPSLRNQHLSVLMTILHRCLGEGDIERASRAWAMLLRMHVSKQGVDITSTGYWQIGAGLLVRRFDKKKRHSYDEDDDDHDDDDDESDVKEEPVKAEDDGVERRWGSIDGLELAKSYYKRLILDYPYNKDSERSVSALDFWPAMVGCEIYGVQMEQKEGLRKVEQQEAKDDEEDGSGEESLDSDDVQEEDSEEDMFAVYLSRKEKMRQKRAEKRLVERDEVRQKGLAASQEIAARMDKVMISPPFSNSHDLLRLRGMLALYIGDLSVPALPLEQGVEEENQPTGRQSLRMGGLDKKSTERRFLYRKRMDEHEQGRTIQRTERERAAKLFDQIIRDGGGDDDIKGFSLGMNEPR